MKDYGLDMCFTSDCDTLRDSLCVSLTACRRCSINVSEQTRMAGEQCSWRDSGRRGWSGTLVRDSGRLCSALIRILDSDLEGDGGLPSSLICRWCCSAVWMRTAILMPVWGRSQGGARGTVQGSCSGETRVSANKAVNVKPVRERRDRLHRWWRCWREAAVELGPSEMVECSTQIADASVWISGSVTYPVTRAGLPNLLVP